MSEALYLNDPDGNGIEVYRDRPRSEWKWQGESVAMTVDPLDTEGLLAEAGPSAAPWGGMPAATTIGHVHLKVNDLATADGFYHGLLGFDITTRYPGAVFVSAGGYHHHLGLNTWQSQGATPPRPGSAGLGSITILLPSPEDLRELQSRLKSAEWPFTIDGDAMRLQDPAGNVLIIQINPQGL